MFGKIFKDLRDNKQLTLIELSEKTGVSKSYLHDIENEKIAPSDKIIEKLFSFYNIPLKEEEEIRRIIAYAKTPSIVKDEFENTKKYLKKVESELERLKTNESEFDFTATTDYYSVPV